MTTTYNEDGSVTLEIKADVRVLKDSLKEAELARQIIELIKVYERNNGTGWRK